MSLERATSSEYEAEANRLRAQIAAKIDALNERLTPSNMASEVASRAGIADLSWSGALAYASKRHPLPTAIIGLGVGIWAFSALRPRSGRGSVRGALAVPARTSAEAIVDSAARVFRQRAEEKRRAFVDVAQAHVATGAETLSVAIEKQLEFCDRSGAWRRQHSTPDRVFDRGCARGRPRKPVAETFAHLSTGVFRTSLEPVRWTEITERRRLNALSNWPEAAEHQMSPRSSRS